MQEIHLPQLSQGDRLLDTIDTPEDLKRIPPDRLDQVAAEIRERIIVTVSQNGGHLASSLGAVELTIALHYVYNTPNDLIVWDVGHQSYAHKLLTGRRERFGTLRRKDGLCGYPKRSESAYDTFGVGHSSTSISAALGMAVARDRLGEDRRVIAIIGDGSMTGGMALEALIHAGHVGTDLLVILNDNEMSISPNVGGLATYFSRLITATAYKHAKEDIGSYVKRVLGERLTRGVQRLEQSVKGFITEGGLFQELGFNYVGPVDGHDLPSLIEFLSKISKLRGPVLLHCRTQKGKGFERAEKDPQKYHGVKPAEPPLDSEGVANPPEGLSDPETAKTFTEVFGEAVVEAAAADPRVAGITAAMPAGTGLSLLEKHYPDRFFDVGICEQHAATFAAGLAAAGMRPICAIYSTFFQRSFDQYMHDVCLQGLPVVFALDRGGLVGEDGPTHSGSFDLTFLRCIPGATVAAPRDAEDLRAMLFWALQQQCPVVLRYPRDKARLIGSLQDRDITRAEWLRQGGDATFLCIGTTSAWCLSAAQILAGEGIQCAVVDARFVKPLDTAMLKELAGRPVITVEESTIVGGFGAAVMEYFEETHVLSETPVLRLGIPDRFVEHGTREEQLADAGLDAQSIARKAIEFLRG